MPKVRVLCPTCRTAYQVDDALVGKKAKCKQPGCGSTFALTATETATAPAPAEPAGPIRSWQPGDVLLDLYEVKGLLGEGGMGRVYRVYHPGWNVDLAVKVPRPDLLQKDGAADNFAREAETWVNLGLHPHTVSCYYVRQVDGLPLVFAELVEGGSLRDWIDSGKLYEGGPEKALERILDIAIQFAWGLHHAHEQGLIHQDVKPANVMMTPDSTAKVTDFGLARARAVAGEQAPAGGGKQTILATAGGMTPAYCSPEQANRQTLTRRTDVYSWAVSVLEMFTGEVTWPSGTVAGEALEAHLEEGSGHDRIPMMPVEVAEMLRRCLREQPEGRLQDLTEVAGALVGLYPRVVRAWWGRAGMRYPRKAPEPAKQFAEALNNRAVSLFDLGRAYAAEHLWGRALQVDPHHPEATYNLGLSQWHAGRLDDLALADRLRQVIAARTGGDWLPSYLLAQVHVERGDCPAAVEILRSLSDRSPANEQIRHLLNWAEDRGAHSRRCLRTLEGHAETVLSVNLSEDNRLALSGSADKTVRIWDVSSGHCLRTLSGHQAAVNFVGFLDGSRLVLSWDVEGRGKLWETATGRGVGTRTFEDEVGRPKGVAFTGDARLALTHSERNSVKLWELNGWRCLRDLTLDDSAPGPKEFALSDDGRLILTWPAAPLLSFGKALTGPATVWDATTGERLSTLVEATEPAKRVILSEGGTHAASVDASRTIQAWSIADGRCLLTFCDGYEVTSLRFTREGRFLLSGNDRGMLRVHETATGQCIRTFQDHAAGEVWARFVYGIRLAGDGRLAVTGGGDKTVRLWDLAPDWNATAPLALSRVVTTPVRVDAEETLARARTAWARRKYRTALQEVSQLRSGGGYERDPEVLSLWSSLYARFTRKELRAGWEFHCLRGHTASVTSVSVSRDGKLAISGSEDRTVKFWELLTGRCLGTFEAHTRGVTSVRLSHDGRLALSGGEDGLVKVWDVQSGGCLRSLESPHACHSVRAVALSSNGQMAFTARSSILEMWEVLTGVSRWSASHGPAVTSVGLSADGWLAFSASEDKTIMFWDAATGRPHIPLTGNAQQVRSVDLSRDGRYLLSGDGDILLTGRNKNCAVCLWDAAARRCIRTFGGYDGDAVWHSVRLSSDGCLALASGADRAVYLWEVATGRCLRVFQGHTAEVRSVDVSDDCGWVVSGGKDGTIRVWFLDWELG